MLDNTYLSLSEFEEAKQYWLNKLSDQIDELSLTFDFPNTNQFHKSTIHFTMSKDIVHELLRISKGHDLSLYTIMLAAFKILLYKHSGQDSIVVVSPVYSVSEQDYNKHVLLADSINPELSFKEFLLKVRETLLEGYKYQYYPADKIIELLDTEYSEGLYHAILLFDAIHNKEDVRDIIESKNNHITFAVSKNGEDIELDIIYDSLLFREDTVKRMFSHYTNILQRVIKDTGIAIKDIELTSDEEKEIILKAFNNTDEEFCNEGTIQELFEKQVLKMPDNIAVTATTDLKDIYEELLSPVFSVKEAERLSSCSFIENPYMVKRDIILSGVNEETDHENKNKYVLIKTDQHNCVVANDNVILLLKYLEEDATVKSLFNRIANKEVRFLICPVNPDDPLEISYKIDERHPQIFVVKDLQDFLKLIKALYKNNLIQLKNYISSENKLKDVKDIVFNDSQILPEKIRMENLLYVKENITKADVLLLGDTPGTATTGILYLASYLRKNNVDAYAQFYDSNWSFEALRANIIKLLNAVCPKIVGISMKWFPHIRRSLEIAKIIKEIAPHTVVVAGGNTASYYWKELIENETIDYIIRGDGEEPLLSIFKNEDYLPNCVYKKDGKIIENPITYIQDNASSKDIFLNELEEVLISENAPMLGTFFINTHKGCPMNCLYCAGCNSAQVKTFNRKKFYMRDVSEVRKDIIEAKELATTFMFDFDAPNDKLLEYCMALWEGIDLSEYFCIFLNLIPPSAELMNLVNNTFKYVYWNLDVCSLSEEHRKKLESLNIVKPQPTDEEITRLLEECEKYPNAEVRVNMIAGLPYSNTKYIQENKEKVAYFLKKYSCFSELHWARLHAQPGAPVAEQAEKYDMHSSASTFEEFLEFSNLNFSNTSNYPDAEYLNYPYIVFNDEALNSEVSQHYIEVNEMIAEIKRERKERLFLYQQLTYKELNAKANQLASYLKETGVKTGDIIAIMMHPTLNMAVSILGTLKAGATYLPIDPNYPKERIEYMLKDSQAEVLLTNKYLAGQVSFDGKIQEIEDEAISSYSDENPVAETSLKDISYIIYTSGSTGTPKGVLVEQKGLANFINWRIKNYNYTPDDVTLQLISVSFDGFGADFYSCLLSGGELILTDQHSRKDFSAVKQIVKHKGVTNMSAVPSMYHALLENSETDELKSLRFVVLAGEAANEKLIRQSHSINSQIQLINEYGPTENTITTTSKIGMSPENASNIGRPIANDKVYILDKNKKVQPVGVKGEMYLSGSGLARGYLNRPELTKERFIDHLFEAGAKMYRTGDFARWLPNGEIEYLGRSDNQVKIRGHRIELGEIETKLLKHACVKNAVVITKDRNSEDKLLVAYIVSDKELSQEELKEFLLQDLPEYMIPMYFIRVDQIPLTPNGKIDKKSLPKIEDILNEDAAYEMPTNSIEEKLLKIWKEVLGIENIGINHKFFDLGGHSLKATILASKIHKELNVEIPLREIFNSQTIKKQALYIKNAEQSLLSSIEVAENKEFYKASSAQKRIYSLCQLEGPSVTYNTPAVLVIEGKLNKDLLKNAFNKLIERHETLRTSFGMADGEVVQYVHPEVDFEMMYSEEKEYTVDKIISDFIKPFDLGKAPLLRAGLIKVEENKHILMYDMHHIIADGMSVSILAKEMVDFYKGESLPKLRVQYKDFSEWQNKMLKLDHINKQEKYWLNTFSGELPVLNLPLDYKRPPVKSFEGDNISFEVDKELAKSLYAITKETGVTLYMLLLAAYNTLLYKYTGQEDIIVGLPIAGRNHADLQDIIGMFVNTLAMRNQPSGEKTFKAFLLEVKENALKAFENQDYQFEELVDKLNLTRDLSRNPLFDTMLVCQNINSESLNIRELSFKPYHRENNKVAKFDITLIVSEEDEKIAFNLEYCTKLFKKESMLRFSGHFINILKQIAVNMDVKLSKVNVLSPEEINTLLYEFNKTALPYEKNKTVHEIFEEQVKKTPDNIAVVFEDEKLTYKELNSAANRLARLLTEKGISKGDIVGIMTGRALESMIGIMAVLKAGGAYLPVDSDYPAERIRYILSDSQVKVLLVSEKQSSTLEFDGEQICLKDLKHLSDKEDSDLNNACSPDDLAYVIYTSGSTGKPKGVMVEHQGIINLREVFKRDYGIRETDRVLQFASLSFDASVYEIFSALLFGAALYIIPKAVINDPDKFCAYLSKNQISVAVLPPTYLQNIDENKITTLRLLTTGGSSPNFELVNKWRTKLHYINAYGPTEATICSTFWDTRLKDSDTVLIGKPIYNTRIYIMLNGDIQPVGAMGEICIAGDGLARGYLNNQVLTDEKFNYLPHIPEERIYKTGDYGRWHEDGNIEFLGRIDHQVKIRGYRIELGEIEEQLMTYEEINKAVVLDKEGQSGDKYLCAYYEADKEIPVKEIREYLQQYLPNYMIPSYFIKIDEVPLTPNDKVDKSKLLTIENNAAAEGNYAEPINAKEEALLVVWKEVLGLEDIGIEDSFFEAGGDSIKAIQVKIGLQEKYGLEMDVKDLFIHNTIRELAASVAEKRIVIDQSPVEGDVELTPIQKWLFEKKPEDGHHFNQAVMLYSKVGFDENIVKKVFDKIAEHHDALRMIYKRSEDAVQQINQGIEACAFDIEVFDLTEDISYENKISEEANRLQASIDLENGPLVKIGLFKTGEGDHLLMIIHHLVVDGVSWRILLEDFRDGYRQALDNKDIHFRPKTTSFKEWAMKLKEYASSSDIEEEISYWEEIEGLSVSPLPKDYECTSNKFSDGKNLSFTLTHDETEMLLKDAQRAYKTQINDLLLSALGLAFKGWTGQDKLLLSLEGHGREEIIEGIDLSRTVGWFTSSYPVSIHLENTEELSHYIKHVKEGLRKIPHNGIGYGILKYLSDSQFANWNLEPEICFNYLGQFENEVSLDGFELSKLDSGLLWGKESERLFALDISGIVIEGQLTLTISYNRNEYDEETINELAQNYKKYLLRIIEHCVQKEDTELTPSDLSYNEMTMDELGDIVDELAVLIED